MFSIGGLAQRMKPRYILFILFASHVSETPFTRDFTCGHLRGLCNFMLLYSFKKSLIKRSVGAKPSFALITDSCFECFAPHLLWGLRLLTGRTFCITYISHKSDQRSLELCAVYENSRLSAIFGVLAARVWRVWGLFVPSNVITWINFLTYYLLPHSKTFISSRVYLYLFLSDPPCFWHENL